MLIMVPHTIKDSDAERDLTKGGAKIVYPTDIRTAVWETMSALETTNLVIIATDQYLAQILDPLYSQLFEKMPVKLTAIPDIEVAPEWVRFVSSLVGIDWMTVYKMVSKPGTQRTSTSSTTQSSTANQSDISFKETPKDASEEIDDIDQEMLG